METLRGSLSFHAPTMVVQAQQRIEKTIRASVHYAGLEVSLKPKDADFGAAQENLELNTAVHETELAELREQVINKFANLSKIKVFTCTILDLDSKLVSSQSRI